MDKKTIVVLTGAGISAESGLKTFRGQGGLWMGYNVYEVASPEGWAANHELVLDFYNQRRKDVQKAQPNAAHKAIAALEEEYRVIVITQNVDDLHERAGSTEVLHLHGSIFQMRSEKNEHILYDIQKDMKPFARADDGGLLRPHVVWFGEAVPAMEQATELMPFADIFILAGTSLQVYPAAGLINYLPGYIPKYVIDTEPPPIANDQTFKVLKMSATEGMRELMKIL